MLAAELISPLVVAELLVQRRADRAGRAPTGRRSGRARPGRRSARARSSSATGDPDREPTSRRSTRFGLRRAAPDVASFGGWFLLAVLVVGLLLAWIWRFRPELWHRNNVLVLIGLLVVGATLALKLTAGRPILPFFLPTAAIGMLLAILLDAAIATIVIALVAVIGGRRERRRRSSSRPTSSSAGWPGIIAVRRGDRLQVFVQAAVAVVRRQRRWSCRSSRCSAPGTCAASSSCGSRRPRLGGRFRRSRRSARSRSSARCSGSSTVFQLLELANPSQPLLRRLLVETPGTYHHSLMVGNLAERAAEAIGADPLRDARRGLLPRRRQAREPAGVHREPGRRREHPRRARPRRSRRDPQAARRRRHRHRLPVRGCRRRSSRSSRSTTGRRS